LPRPPDRALNSADEGRVLPPATRGDHRVSVAASHQQAVRCRPALNDVTLNIAEGEFVCFLGPSGCGKTTLLRVIAGLETPDTGEVTQNGTSLIGVPARLRNFGIVFQSYSLFPNMTVGRNIGYGLECRKWPKDAIDRASTKC
jgi:ABC-type Fe3+/spermidine/putrescine transport system ATPase subunit